MGASQSTRKLTIANEEDDANVIRISDAVAKRLAQSTSEISADSAKPKEVRATATQQGYAPPAAAQARATAIPDYADTYYYPPATISALEMQQMKEKELAEQQEYWQQRIKNLEKKHENIDEILEKEYKTALHIFDDCRVHKVKGVKVPCLENKQKVLKCYSENPKETLRCADLVEKFTNCVDERRSQLTKCN